MKKLLCLAVLISVFVFTSTVAASEPVPPYDPPVVPVNQTLLDKYKEFFPPKVITVTDGVYVANGYNRDNPTLIEGPNGLIVVDPGESIEAGQKARAAFNAALDNIFDKKPVKAIIYTHDHDCHVNGATAFAGPQTEIIGHVDLMSSLYSEWFGQVFPSRAEGGVKMAGLLFMDAPVKPNPGHRKLGRLVCRLRPGCNPVAGARRLSATHEDYQRRYKVVDRRRSDRAHPRRR